MEKGTNNNNPRLSPSLLDLKTKIQHSFVNDIDKDHDGIVTTDELLSTYDTDHSGTLEKDELARLAKQLSVQTQDNNNLLLELQRLEEQQLKSQKDVQAKQDALRKSLDALDHSRGEALSLKKELNMIKSKEDSTSRDVITYKKELERTDRKLELAIKEKALAVRQAEDVEDERASITHQFHDTLNEKKELIEQLEAAKRGNAKLQVGLKTEVKTLQEQLDKMGSQMKGLIERDNANVKTLQATQKSLVEKSNKAKKLEANVQDARRRCLELEDIVHESQLLQQNLRSSLNQANDRVQKLENELQEYKNVHAKHDEMINQAKEEANEYATNHKLATYDRDRLREEIINLRKELNDTKEQHSGENLAYEKQITENHDQLEALSSEARERHREYSDQVQRIAGEHRKQLAGRDEQYVKLQNDYKQLHDILDRVQGESSSQTKSFEEERAAYERRVEAAIQRANETEKNAHELETNIKEENDKLLQNLHSVQRELHSRTDRYVATLNSMQSVFKDISNNISQENNDLQIMRDDVNELKRTVESQGYDLLQPNEAKHGEMRGTVQDMHKMMQHLHDQFETSKDMRQSTEALLENVRSDNIMLREEVSKLEMENHSLKIAQHDVEAKADAHIKASSVEAHSAISLRNDLQTQLDRMMEQLDQANQLSRKLQADNRDLQNRLHLSQQQAAHKTQVQNTEILNAKTKVDSLSLDNKRATTERDQLRRDVQSQADEVKRLQNDLIKRENEYRQNLQKEKSNQGKYKNQVLDISDSFRKLQSQLNQTKSLLNTVQEQRKLLNDDNANLRRELDSIYTARRLSMIGNNDGGVQIHATPMKK
jgi:chromosome segregation ATPase